MHRHAEWIVATISTICLILTIAVYLYVKMLRNTLGKCIVSCLLSMVMVQVIFIQNSLNFLFHLFATYCIINGKVFLFSIAFEWTRNFFQYAYFIWLSVISYHLWQVFKSPRSDDHSRSFLAYSAFVWITAGIITGFFFFLNAQDDERLTVLCMLLGSLIFHIFNLIMFILTTISIWKVKGEMKRFTRRKDKTTTCFNFDTETYLQFLRMSIMMGLSWSFVIVVYVFNNFFSSFNHLQFIIDLHHAFVIYVFILLIVKRSTINLIMESIRERQIKRRVRAQMERDLP
ncbi:probable G-protein coupled receptor Mth-like 7 [Drosophila biarmipes]|uniref:probable G-protein coupled receptor Mth-like 7 n=1 Tax=Drosophila biarmipes TaxID=125945 RepID=UPI0007E71254|nr:probable G-protein coupled receptor Mth-like 7 [Drosophila biarmipes]